MTTQPETTLYPCCDHCPDDPTCPGRDQHPEPCPDLVLSGGAAAQTLPGYVYVASSWRNMMQPTVVREIEAIGIECYDFRNPAPGESGFAWSEIDPDWINWSAEQYVKALDNPIAEHGFRRDFDAMQRADTFVLVLPCGRSAHLELGWAVGAGKRTAILTRDGEEPELMAKMVDHIATSLDDLLAWLGVED